MTDVSFVALDEFLSKIIESLKVIAGVSDLVRLKSKPLNRLFYRSKVDFFLGLRIRIIIS